MDRMREILVIVFRVSVMALAICCGLTCCKTSGNVDKQAPHKSFEMALDAEPAFVNQKLVINRMFPRPYIVQRKMPVIAPDSLRDKFYIERLERFKDYYIIYAWKDSKVYKIVSQFDSAMSNKGETKLAKDHYYDFRIEPIIQPGMEGQYLHIEQISISDDGLTLYNDPDIPLLHFSPDINGLYLLE